VLRITGCEWDEWNIFFFNAIIKQADLNIVKVKKIIALYSDLQDKVRVITKSKYAQELVDVIFARPILGVKDLIERSKVPKPTAHKLIKILLDAKILVVLKEGAGRSPSILSNYQLLDIVK
jgi:Fic family protein